MVKIFRLVAIEGDKKEIELNGKKVELFFPNDQVESMRVVKIKGNVDQAELSSMADKLGKLFPQIQFLLLQETDDREFNLFKLTEVKEPKSYWKLFGFPIKFEK